MNIASIILFLFTTLIFSYADTSGPSPVSLSTSVDKLKITIGEKIRYAVKIKRRDDVKVAYPGPGANLGNFEIIDYKRSDAKKLAGGLTEEEIEYFISAYETGRMEIGNLGIFYLTTGGDSGIVASPKFVIDVRSVKSSQAKDIKDIKNPIDVPADYTILIIVMAITAGGIIYYFIWRKYLKKETVAGLAEPERDPGEVALEELDNILEGNMLGDGMLKEYYSAVSDVVRRFLERRFNVLAMEMATPEIASGLRKKINHVQLAEMEEFLNDCDMVKFAKYVPDEEETRNIVPKAKEIITKL